MRPSFLPRLVNSELYDPIVYVRILNEKKSLMFDCGRIEGLAAREILCLDAIFISHTHMDHFIGIDQVLRIILHRDKPMHIYGPEGITAKMLAKLHAYTWNLTQDYPLDIIIHEVQARTTLVTRTSAATGFEVISQETLEREGPAVVQAPRYRVDAVILDHHIACLGFVLKEIFHVNIRRDMIKRRGYIPGRWIGRLKECILSGDAGEIIEVDAAAGTRQVRVCELADDLVIMTSGQKIAFFTDIGFCEENVRLMESIAGEVDILFIETYYLDDMQDQASLKGHLTARQAGMIARRLGAKRVFPMHVSPRYHDRVSEIWRQMELDEP